jgi:quinol monooxygenase YgiN
LNRDADDPTAHVMYEKFRDVPVLEAHLNLERTTKLFKAIGPLTDGEFKAKVYEVPG